MEPTTQLMILIGVIIFTLIFLFFVIHMVLKAIEKNKIHHKEFDISEELIQIHNQRLEEQNKAKKKKQE